MAARPAARGGVDTRWFTLDQRRQTPIAFATVTAAGEPTFAIYGEGISAALVDFGDRAGEAVEATEALVFASNTLVGPEREVTLRGCLEGCLLVKANANEARLLTAEREPAAAAEAIAAMGVQLVVITLGPDGADPSLRDALGAAAEAGARATESWGAVA